MSQKYPGGFITKTPTAPTSSAAPGIWTLDQAMQNQKAGNWPSPPSPYIEDYFSTYLYTGNGSTQTITNGINLSANGGLVWIKSRGQAANHRINDTAAAVAGTKLAANTTAALAAEASGLTSFNSNGFSIGSDGTINTNADPLVSWTFAERQKFFDVVTYTGNGTAGRTVAHSLTSVPGCFIVKCTSNGSTEWFVYHRSLTSANYHLRLSETNAEISLTAAWNDTAPTSSVFTLGTDDRVNGSGRTYVAYLFAHNAGGFGLSGSDNVISCGSYTGSSSNVDINLGYEAQWVLVKNITTAGTNWQMLDIMRGMPLLGSALTLAPNLADADSSNTAPVIIPTATGMTITGGIGGSINSAGSTYIYIAIRRGPMKVPTLGTSVLNAITRSGNSTATTVTGVGFAPDLVFEAARTNSGGNNWVWFDRLRGGARGLSSDNTGAEFTNSAVIQSDSLSTTMDGFRIQTANPINASGNTYVYYPLKRAPGFFDEVCYTGTASNPGVLTHNLGVVPELMIVKQRTPDPNYWAVYTAFTGNTKSMLLPDDGAAAVRTTWSNTSPTATTFTVENDSRVFSLGRTYVAYLFATCPGVSKVGNYTGTAALLTVDCGFTSGARFVLIKRTNSTGDWYVWDSARGISSGNDPYLLLNTTGAEVTGTNYVDTDTTGFKVTAAAPAALNASGSTYIFLAIA